MKTPNRIIVAAGAILLALLIWNLIRKPAVTMYVGETEFNVLLAIGDKEKELGLGGRDQLPDKTGMLFPYRTAQQYQFWMKGMEFPLDFIWIRDKAVVELTEDVPVYTNGKHTVVTPLERADMVFEINAGTIKRFGIAIGDRVILDP